MSLLGTSWDFPKKSDASLKEAKVTGPFSDYQKAWLAGLTQAKGLFR